MALTEYKKKRTFKTTPEPTGGKPAGKKLSFVVQKHAASRLHYDFRLELNGVLLSWAVPKGPSLNPADKRLAMRVEDHPFDYKDFEGIIPEGNYGAGTVIVWDRGTYEPVAPSTSKKEQERILEEQLKKGSLKIRLHGEKLKGEFALVDMKGRGDKNAWLLIKHRDEFVSKGDITAEEESAVSGKTLEQVAGSKSAKIWGSNRRSTRTKAKAPKVARRVVPSRKAATKTNKPTSIRELLENVKGKKRSALPAEVSPMLATLVDKPVAQQEWLYEVKWDGFRAISFVNQGEVKIRSRNDKDFNQKFYPVHEALASWNVDAVVDGEIIVVGKDGTPDFSALQGWRSEADGHLVYYLFDVLWLAGYNLMNVPLATRKAILLQAIPTDDVIRISENFAIDGTEFFELADRMGLEGIVAKKADSVYQPGQRTKTWLKIKTEKQQEAVIAGYTRNENLSRKFSALLLGIYDHGELKFIGPVGTGFTRDTQDLLLQKMASLVTEKCPFKEVPDYNKPSRFRPNPPRAEVVWLKPRLVAEVNYRALGADGTMRHPSFKGLREDKNPRDVVRETPAPTNEIVGDDREKRNERKKEDLSGKVITTVARPSRQTLLNPGDETQVRKIDGRDLKFTNLSKVFWPEDGYTKRDMLNYYYQVAPMILPYMSGRPQTLNRFPNGIHGQSFYQKDVTGKVPAWIKKYRYFSEGDKREKHFLVCTDEASLLYMASLGCIEMNPWSSRVEKPDHPDWCVIDLDPGKKTTFDQVIEAAKVTKEVLDTLKLPSYCKTSGSTGLHVYVPLGALYTYEESKEFARALVKVVHAQIRSFTTLERKVSDRNGKMYLDFLQNRPQATLAGPYSLRPKVGAPVSTPLHWEEVRKGMRTLDFSIKNAIARFRETGDLFAGVLGKGIDLHTAMEALNNVSI